MKERGGLFGIAAAFSRDSSSRCRGSELFQACALNAAEAYWFLHLLTSPPGRDSGATLERRVWDHNRLSSFCPVALVLVPFPVFFSLCVSPPCPETAHAAFPTDLSV